MAKLSVYPGRKRRVRRPSVKPLFPGWEMRQYLRFIPDKLNSKKTPKEKAISIALGIVGSRKKIPVLAGMAGVESNKANILLNEAWRVWRIRGPKSRKRFTTSQANAFLNIVKDFYDNLPE